MQFFAKAVITGFGLSLGAALYKRVAKQLGFDEPDPATEKVRQQDGATDPELQEKPQFA